jgi:hypothetical protein
VNLDSVGDGTVCAVATDGSNALCYATTDESGVLIFSLFEFTSERPAPVSMKRPIKIAKFSKYRQLSESVLLAKQD